MFRFQCVTCDKWHVGEPSLAFAVPDYLSGIPQDQHKSRVRCSEDLCAVDDEFFFARVSLEIPIIGASAPFLWGIWVTLSRRSFDDYTERFERREAGGPYFSWLANELPGYPPLAGQQSRIFARAGGLRPLVKLEESDHPLSVDFHKGMSADRAEAIFQMVLHRTDRAH
ncbi:DUF2199 domain-containing protein [Caballeronia sp. LjRoot29]|uniref:DUF2199 domain-containing protein n=1 Tax=Caballeronia sp. LjRoot29 TaxID=3342315 RepID=UPI003ECEAD63